MKTKIMITALAATGALLLAGCSSGSDSTEASESIEVIEEVSPALSPTAVQPGVDTPPVLEAEVNETTSSNEWTPNPSLEERLAACQEFKEFAEVLGITDADELLDVVIAASNSEDPNGWDDSPAAQKADVARATQEAMTGGC